VLKGRKGILQLLAMNKVSLDMNQQSKMNLCILLLLGN